MEDREIEALREQVRESSANRWAQSGHGSKLGIVEPKTENCGGNSDPMNEARVHGKPKKAKGRRELTADEALLRWALRCEGTSSGRVFPDGMDLDSHSSSMADGAICQHVEGFLASRPEGDRLLLFHVLSRGAPTTGSKESEILGMIDGYRWRRLNETVMSALIRQGWAMFFEWLPFVPMSDVLFVILVGVRADYHAHFERCPIALPEPPPDDDEPALMRGLPVTVKDAAFYITRALGFEVSEDSIRKQMERGEMTKLTKRRAVFTTKGACDDYVAARRVETVKRGRQQHRNRE